MKLLFLLHVLVLLIKPLRRWYVRYLPHSLCCSVGLVVGWFGGLWLVLFGLPPALVPVSAAISGMLAAKIPSTHGWPLGRRRP